MKTRKPLDVEWNIPDMNKEELDSLIEFIVDIYTDAVIEKLKTDIDKN